MFGYAAMGNLKFRGTRDNSPQHAPVRKRFNLRLVPHTGLDQNALLVSLLILQPPCVWYCSKKLEAMLTNPLERPRFLKISSMQLGMQYWKPHRGISTSKVLDVSSQPLQNTIQVVGRNSVVIPTSNKNPDIHSFRRKTNAATVISHSVAMVSYGPNCFLCIFFLLDPHEVGTLNLQNKRGASNKQSLNSSLSWS